MKESSRGSCASKGGGVEGGVSDGASKEVTEGQTGGGYQWGGGDVECMMVGWWRWWRWRWW